MKLSVIGAGQMGSGIAQVAAIIAKIPQVVLFDQNKNQLDRQMGKMRDSLNKSKSKGIVTENEVDFTFSAIKTSTNLSDIEGSDFIIEVKKLDSLIFMSSHLLGC